MQLKLVGVPLPNSGIREILSVKLQQLSVWTRQGARNIEFDWGRLWSALQETGIKLSILEVSGMENAIDKMFTYLLSYAGLKRLEILHLEMDTQEMEDKAAQKFWDKVVPHHWKSLTTLFIGSNVESEWGYGPRAAISLRKCSSLQNLTISARSVSSPWARTMLSRACEYNNVEFCELQEPHGAAENCGVRLAICNEVS